MGLNETPSGERKHISFFGCRNAGKSSLLNAVTGQKMAIVSDIKGTTTDPVFKALELLPAGPVIVADTPGLDDEGTLGEMRIASALKVLRRTDLAILVVDASVGIRAEDKKILQHIKEKNIPYIMVYNKIDLLNQSDMARKSNLKQDPETEAGSAEKQNINPVGEAYKNDASQSDKKYTYKPDINIKPKQNANFTDKQNTTPAANLRTDSVTNSRNDPVTKPEIELKVSTYTGEGINELKETIAKLLTDHETEKTIVGDLVSEGDMVVLVVPIDKAAPKGRLILPQQQTIRDLIDHGAVPIVTRDTELKDTIEKLGGLVKLVITDSQAFKKVAEIIPESMPLTSFSILFSRYKGELEKQLAAIETLDKLKDGDRILIAEGCTHHRQCGDIGTEKIPAMLKSLGNFEISFTSGQEFHEDLTDYSLVIHCGGCMLNEREMKARISLAENSKTPITNYGMFMARMTGVLERSMEPLKREN